MSKTIRFGPFELEEAQRRLLRDGQALDVQPKTLDFIILLAGRAGELLRRAEIMDALWPDVVVTDASLARCAKEARQVLGDDAANPVYIETVPKAGYRFVAAVDSAAVPPQSRRVASLWIWITLIVMVLVAAFFAGRVLFKPMLIEGTTSAIGPEQSDGLDVTSLNAQRAFELGRQAMAYRSGPKLVEARGHFERALEVDPRHAPAMAGLAISTLLIWRTPDPEIERRTLALAERALSIDPELAWAHTAVGLLHMRLGDDDELARASLQRAVEIDPGIVEAYVGLATLASNRGDISASIELQQLGLSKQPTHATLGGNLALNLLKVGRYEEAFELIDSFKEIAPARQAMIYPEWIALSASDRKAEAILLLLEGIEEWPAGTFMPGALAGDLVEIGDHRGANRIASVLMHNCNPALGKIAGQHEFRIALGGPALDYIEQLTESLEEDANDPIAIRWLARRAFIAGNYAEASLHFHTLYPTPEAIVSRQGGIDGVANDAQFLAYSLVQTGDPSRAESYLLRIQSMIEQRKVSGFSLYDLMVIEARNAALLGDADRAFELMGSALSNGWIDVAVWDDPRWDNLRDSSEFSVLRTRMLKKAEEINWALQGEDFSDRLQEVLERIPGAYAESIANMPVEALDSISDQGSKDCFLALKQGQ